MAVIAEAPFAFIGCSELQESLAHQADDEKKLAELIEEVPLDSIHFHTHSYFLRHGLIEGTYPNDFAQWVVMQIGDHVLGERLAIIDPKEGSLLPTDPALQSSDRVRDVPGTCTIDGSADYPA